MFPDEIHKRLLALFKISRTINFPATNSPTTYCFVEYIDSKGENILLLARAIDVRYTIGEDSYTEVSLFSLMENKRNQTIEFKDGRIEPIKHLGEVHFLNYKPHEALVIQSEKGLFETYDPSNINHCNKSIKTKGTGMQHIINSRENLLIKYKNNVVIEKKEA